MKPHRNLFIRAVLCVAGLIVVGLVVAVSESLSGRYVIGEIPMDDGRVVRVVQDRLGILRTMVGDCVTLVEVELASGSVRTATLSADDSIRSEMKLSRRGGNAIVEWFGSPLTIDPNAMFLLESNGEVFQPFDDLIQPLGL